MTRCVEVDLALGLLDHQLVDSDGRRCGNVDDLELGGSDAPHVVAILVGPPVWRGRGLIGRLAAMFSHAPTVRIPWGEVDDIDAVIQLRKPAAELGLGRGDDRVRSWIEWIPGS